MIECWQRWVSWARSMAARQRQPFPPEPLHRPTLKPLLTVPKKPGSADNLSYLALLSHSSVLVASIPIPCPSCMLAAHDVHKTCTKTLCFIAPLYSDIAPKTRWSWIS